jgi:hypothetical protein
MSNHHARQAPPQRKSFRVPWVVALSILVSLMFVLPLIHLWWRQNSTPQDSWPSVGAHVLGTRIVTIGAFDGGSYHGGVIEYRAEAHVAYELNGVHRDEWLPASDISSDRLFLQFVLWQKKDKLCTVRWNPKNPSNAIAVLS